MTTPEQKRCLAMAATDADGHLVWAHGGWRRPHHADDKPVSSAVIQECRKAGWLVAVPQRNFAKIVFAVKITPAGAQEALRS